MSTIKLHGLKELKRNMRGLSPRVQKNVLTGAVSFLARTFRDEAKKGVPREFGTLEDNIIAKRRRARRGVSRSSVIVREEGGRDDPQNAFYWFFVEYGHFARDGVTWIPGSAFMSNAFDNVRVRLDSLIASYMRPRTEKEFRKMR